MLVGRRNAMNRWNERFMAQLGSSIVTFDASYVDMGGAPTNQAMCDYMNSRYHHVLPQQVCITAGMRARLIRNVSLENRLVNSTLVVIKRWSNDVIVVSPVGRAREYPICRFQQIIPVYGPSVQVKIIRFPTLPGYSCTVHGTQGCSYDRVWVDMAAFFAAAHAYITRSFTSRPIHPQLPSWRFPCSSILRAIMELVCGHKRLVSQTTKQSSSLSTKNLYNITHNWNYVCPFCLECRKSTPTAVGCSDVSHVQKAACQPQAGHPRRMPTHCMPVW